MLKGSVLLAAGLMLAIAAPAPAVPGGRDSAVGPAAKKTKKKRRVCRQGERSRRTRPCIRAPRNANRPRGHGQQGGPNNLIPVPTTGGLGASGFDREESAIAWALNLRHSPEYAWWCERFVENAFNVADQYPSAARAATALRPLHKGSPPRGALVFFRADAYNKRLGHVGIALGKGKFISALNTVEESSLTQEYWAASYSGWSYAPESWEGRLLIPSPPDPGLEVPPAGPSGQQPPAATARKVELTSPRADTTLTGTVVLTAHTENASGVAFDAYYASDPKDVNTIGWHRLGEARPTGGGDWTMPYDTRAIPNQGTAAWGTVTVMAIALNETGEPTAARDFHRVDVMNPTGPSPEPQPPPPPPPPASYAFHVLGTCAEGACGLKKRAGPGYSSYAQLGIAYDGQQIDIVCQTAGETVFGRRATSNIWDRLTDGSYVSDYYTDTPVVGGFSAPIPRC